MFRLHYIVPGSTIVLMFALSQGLICTFLGLKNIGADSLVCFVLCLKNCLISGNLLSL